MKFMRFKALKLLVALIHCGQDIMNGFRFFLLSLLKSPKM